MSVKKLLWMIPVYFCINTEIALGNPVENIEEAKELNFLETHVVPEINQPKYAQITPEGQKVYQDTPLTYQQFPMPTADHLAGGDWVFKLYNRFFFPPGEVENTGTSSYPNLGLSWGITDSTQLTFDVQLVDSGNPGRQGPFESKPKADQGANFTELTLELKQKFWQNETFGVSGVLSLSYGDRDYRFSRNGVVIDSGSETSLVPSLQIPFTAKLGEKAKITISPTVAFFAEDSAMYLHTPPLNDPGSFGTTFGFRGGVSYNINERITLWGDAFIPVTGNNSVSRSSGKPAQAIVYNAGLRYLINPRVGVDLFASNAYGSTGSLALTGDRDFIAFGAGIVFMPGFMGANGRYADNFEGETVEDTPRTVDGIGFFDGGTLPSGRFLLDIQGGSQGIMSALRFGIVKDFEIGAYLDYISGDVDESEQGISGKLRLLNQAKGDPFTLSIAGTLGQTNEPFVNFINNDKKRFDQRNLDKNVPFLLDTDDKATGKLFITTISLPLNYQFDSGAAIWFTPIWTYVQRSGTEIAGFNLGGSLPIFKNFSIVGEVGANIVGDGNAFIGNKRENVIPWSVGVRWNPSELFGLDPNSINPPQLQLYVTNRVGSSTWHELRVRDQNEIGVGFGLSIPF